MQFLLAVDMEGVHGVVGEPYKGLSESPEEYALAQESAVLEINAAARALFDSGADKVVLWDNHHKGNNFDYALIDPRIEIANWRKYPTRMGFAKDYDFSGIVYLGYHAKEGTLGAVLAHTYTSSVQYIKLDGRAVGELDVDTYLAATYGIPPLFIAADDHAVSQLKEISPLVGSVITKQGKGRNSAVLRDRDTVLEEIYSMLRKAACEQAEAVGYKFPALLEIRYTRAERAEEKFNALQKAGRIPVRYGEDSHTLIAKTNGILDVIAFI